MLAGILLAILGTLYFWQGASTYRAQLVTGDADRVARQTMVRRLAVGGALIFGGTVLMFLSSGRGTDGGGDAGEAP